MNLKTISINVFLVVACAYAHGDMITINNKASKPLTVALYHIYNNNGTRASEILEIPGTSAITVARPERRLLYDRAIIATYNKDDLKPTLNPTQLEKLPTTNIGTLKGTEFFFTPVTDQVEGFNTVEWNVHQSLQKLGQPLAHEINNILHVVHAQNPYAKKRAEVRKSIDLGAEEKNYLTLRKPHVKKSLEKLLGVTLQENEVPRIALLASGGGYRAMIAALGSMIGAQEMGLWDATTYVMGLSGGAWATTVAQQHGTTKQALTNLMPLLAKSIFSKPINKTFVGVTLISKIAFTQPITLVDFFGVLLSEKILARVPFYARDISRQAINLTQGAWPMPLYSAILAQRPYEWFEFTPFEAGSTYLKAFIPVWAFGRKFKNGLSTNLNAPQNLGYIMGICGSAFTASLRDALEHTLDEIDPRIAQVIRQEDVTIPFGAQRISPGRDYNFNYDMENMPANDQLFLTLVDAGLDFNIPFPPALRKERAIDIIIAFDNSATIAGGFELKGAERYVRRLGLPFPIINYEQIDTKICSIFKSNNLEAPIIIYLPLIKNPLYSSTFDPSDCTKNSYCATTNFAYTAEQVNQLSGLTAFNLKQAKQQIIDVINMVIERKKIKK